MEGTVQCKNCGVEVTLKVGDIDRYCRKCGTALFVPIIELDVTGSVNDANWIAAYNSFYNYPELFSNETQYSINRYCNWRWGITNIGRMMRRDTEKLDTLLVFYKSFVRAGYVFRITEEKSTKKALDPALKKEVMPLKKKGKESIESKNKNLFTSAWDLYPLKDPKHLKVYAENILYLTTGIAEGDLDKFLLLPKGKVEERFSTIVADLSNLLIKGGFSIQSSTSTEIDDRVIGAVIFGHSVRVAETLLNKE
ncbi:zinc ribbon domain-containing protein [Patescibacteria group bacterium]|nr:MAG: zinc ribbon domain-containing protein [Patescibacteria group bacterium]